MGRPKLASADKRDRCVSVRLSEAEYTRLVTDAQAQHTDHADVIRNAYLGCVRHSVPAANLELWRQMAPLVSNLNQIAYHLNAGGVIAENIRPDLAKLFAAVLNLRAELKGGKAIQ